MVLVADFAHRPDATALQRAVVSLAQAAQWAAGFDVRLALEFRGSDAFCTSLDTALGLVAQCGEPNVGVCLDLFHYYKGPSKPEDLAGLTRETVAFVQFVEALKRIGYDGHVSLEVTNPVLWEMKLTQVAELGLMALRRVIG